MQETQVVEGRESRVAALPSEMVDRPYCVLFNSYYRIKEDFHAFHFWTQNQPIILTSPMAFVIGDIVRVTEIRDNTISIVPVSASQEEEPWNMVFLTTGRIPVNEAHTYEFSTEDGEVLLVKESLMKGNKSYIVVAGVRPKPISTVVGREINSSIVMEWIVYNMGRMG